MTPRHILDFWFLSSDDPDYLKERVEWFRKDEGFDAQIRSCFGIAIEQALSEQLNGWDITPQGVLARILLLDQFTRNAFRDTPKAFAGDEQALHCAQALVARGDNLSLLPAQQRFAYMPYMHAESLRIQEEGVKLFEILRQTDAAFDATYDYALRHRDIIARFGRFPHRNTILGRTSSLAEIEFLKRPGSGF